MKNTQCDNIWVDNDSSNIKKTTKDAKPSLPQFYTKAFYTTAFYTTAFYKTAFYMVVDGFYSSSRAVPSL